MTASPGFPAWLCPGDGVILIETLAVKLLPWLQVIPMYQAVCQLCHRELCDHNTVLMTEKERLHLGR